MEYGRLQPTNSARLTEPSLQTQTQTQTQNRNQLLSSYLARFVKTVLVLVLVASLVLLIVVVLKHIKHSSSSSTSSFSGGLRLKWVTKMCRKTRFPELCVNSLGDYIVKDDDDDVDNEGMVNDGSNEVEEEIKIVDVSLNVTLQRLLGSLDYFSSEIIEVDDDHGEYWSSVHEDCVELIGDSVDLLTRARSLLSHLNDQSSAMLDMMVWMTAALTNQDTCTEGFEETGLVMKDQTTSILRDLARLMIINLDLSDSSGVVTTTSGSSNENISSRQLIGSKHTTLGYPKWVSNNKRELLNADNITPNITVSQDGIGPPNVTAKTITEAIKMAPKNSSSPIIIHIKAGRYEEVDLTIGKEKTNIWFIGDGKGQTIITGQRSVVLNKTTTYRTASLGVTGSGFVAKGITFENTAGPENHQAVALRVKSDQAVVYQCEMKGYQDTLYVHSNRQFYRECDIYGTVDFIFGNAVALFQNCTLYARKPMEQQKNTITAQKRSDQSMYSGISIQDCQVRAAPDLEPVKANYSTYLGRPWKELAVVVYMLTYIDDHVDPQGWLPWNSTSTLDTVYLGEYLNHGPGANISQRVKAPGVHINMSVTEATNFTVDKFEAGTTWIMPTEVPFEAGLGH